MINPSAFHTFIALLTGLYCKFGKLKAWYEVTSEVKKILEPHDFNFETRGIVDIKGKGQMETFWLQGPRPDKRVLNSTDMEDRFAWKNREKILKFWKYALLHTIGKCSFTTQKNSHTCRQYIYLWDFKKDWNLKKVLRTNYYISDHFLHC